MDKNTSIGLPMSAVLDEAVRRILSVVQPHRIILFGSAVHGTMKPDSDLDLLIVMSNDVHRRNTAVEIYRVLRGIGLPKDVIVVTENDVKAHRHNPSLVLKPALDEGKELYVAT
jgi:uncharacterized protein